MITKKAGYVQVGDRFFSSDGKHPLVTKVEPLQNSHYVNITYHDRHRHDSMTYPYEVNADVDMADEEDMKTEA
jgi:hypothetical protein